MNLRDISDKLKETIIPREVKKEDFELTESEKKEIGEDENIHYEQMPISDEVEQLEGEPIKIRTMLVKSEDQEEDAKEKKLKGAVKIAAGVGVVAVAGLAAFLLGSRKKKW